MTRGYVSKDGKSALPAGMGITDLTEGADKLQISPELQARLDAIFNGSDLDNIKAKYKLEIVINEERSTIKPYFGLVTAWVSGGFAHGGGDEAIYFCTSIVERNGEKKTCSAPIDLKWVGAEVALCPTCRNSIDPKKLAGQVGFRLTTQNWSEVITRMWLLLEGDADIRLGVMKGKIRDRTSDIMKKVSLGAGDKLDDLRLKREWSSYPLRNIIKDTSAGADLQGRVRAFFNNA